MVYKKLTHTFRPLRLYLSQTVVPLLVTFNQLAFRSVNLSLKPSSRARERTSLAVKELSSSEKKLLPTCHHYISHITWPICPQACFIEEDYLVGMPTVLLSLFMLEQATTASPMKVCTFRPARSMFNSSDRTNKSWLANRMQCCSSRNGNAPCWRLSYRCCRDCYQGP